MRTLIAASLLLAAVPSPAPAEDRADLAPAYSRDGFDFFSAPLEPAMTQNAPSACEKQFGKHTEVQESNAGYLCSVPTPSEPRLSTKLKEELALVDAQTEAKRQAVEAALIDKYQHLAQCPAGTAAYYDGAMYFCGKTYPAKELCPAGTPTTLESGQVGCAVSTCPKGATDLAALTHGQHPGCFKCPRGAYDAKETDAFHGALKGMPAEYTAVFCKAKARQ